MNARNELYEKIMMMFITHKIDITDIKDEVNILLSDYEVQNRITEVALRHEDRNEFLIKKFIISKTVKGCTKRTLKYYTEMLIFILGRINKTVDDIEADDIRLYLALRQKRDQVSRTTADNELRILRTFYTYLTAEELVLKNPTMKIDRIKKDTKKEPAFTELEVEKIRNCLKNTREKAVVEMMLSTGCRVGELTQMKIQELKDGVIVVHGKGEKDRITYLNAKAQLALDEYLKERKDGNPYIFCGGVYGKGTIKGYARGKRGEWYKYKELVGDGHASEGSIESMMRRIGKRCGVEGSHPHRFRKTCATMALRRGMPLEKVSKMLGHENLETTKIYISIGEEELEQAHRKYVI